MLFPRVPALSEKFAELYLLTTTNIDGALPKMAKEYECVAGVNRKMVPGKRNPSPCCSFPLTEGIAE